jgi:hypothetical protein
LLIVKKPDVIQKNELYFCNQGSKVIQNQLSKSKHRLKSFVLQACVILIWKSQNFQNNFVTTKKIPLNLAIQKRQTGFKRSSNNVPIKKTHKLKTT